jgi:hypothetical protein
MSGTAYNSNHEEYIFFDVTLYGKEDITGCGPIHSLNDKNESILKRT